VIIRVIQYFRFKGFRLFRRIENLESESEGGELVWLRVNSDFATENLHDHAGDAEPKPYSFGV